VVSFVFLRVIANTSQQPSQYERSGRQETAIDVAVAVSAAAHGC
jgi:hypothetical protein